MKKLSMLLASLTLAAAGIAFVPQAASASGDYGACSTSTVVQANGGAGFCQVTISVTVPTAATLTFTTVISGFGSRLPGTTTSLPNTIVGSFYTNSGTATLQRSCVDGVPAGFTGSSMFRWAPNSTTAYNQLDPTGCTDMAGVTGRQTHVAPAAATTFSDSLRVDLDASQAAGTFTQTVRYTLSVV